MGGFMFVWSKRKVKHYRTKDSDSDSEGRCSKENRQDLSKPAKFVSSRKRKHETDENSYDGIIMTSTECANMFKEHIIHSRVKELKEGIGPKLMRKMGYKEGHGIGKYGQGIVNPIEVNMRPKFQGLGYKKYNETANVTAGSQETSDENKALSQPSKKRKTEHVTAKKLRLAELDMQIIECELNNEREKVVSLRKEKERLVNDANRKRKQLDDLEVIESALDKLNNDSHSGTLSLELLGDSFRYLKKRFPDEYKLCGLSTIACSFALPLFSRLFKGWDPLIKPADHIDVISVWKDLLQGDEIDSPYAKLFAEAVFRAVRRSSANSWQATNPEPLLHFLDIWERLMPHAALQKILDQIVMPKLLAAVNSWDPRTDTIPMHIWVHPWLPLVDQKHTTLYHTVQTKLESVLNEWHPSDESAYDVLSPWKPVFDRESWEQIMVRCITPKLLAVMQEFQVNPADQKLDQFYWVLRWTNLIPIHHMLQITDVFFNKWLAVLYKWLCSKPDLQEVRNWYLGWKNLIPTNLLSNEHIRGRLNMGLVMMNQAVQGLEVVPPGLREKVSDKKAREQMDDMGSMSLKEIIELHAQHNDLLFKLKPGRMHDGHQVYGFGNISIIMDSFNQKVFALTEDKWSVVSLEQLMKLQKSSVQRRN
ncbi:septin and tuftelin-interacting protein 1 homolog 1 [Tanacetum coccineum]|uniref:Septin and tuftelin-interacting protein 1 homolog 1 n=1 Tax=Tanacetum coccineum TaxID=301880 RepID=A0ABQ5EFK8_9ASTR